MNRRSILSISAMTMLGLAFVPSSAVSQQNMQQMRQQMQQMMQQMQQQQSLKDQLVGTWMLVSQELTAPDGTKRQGPAGVVVGHNPRGILILDAGGRYANVTGAADRPKFKTSGVPRLEGTAEEFKAAVQSFAANYGTWSVNEADKTLTLRLESAMIPNAEGTDDKTSVGLAGDELKLSASFASGRRDEVYRRAK
jgi:hypothetical protein